MEQTAAAAESMRMQTAKLTEAVSAFRVEASTAPAMARAAARPAAPKPAAPAQPKAGGAPAAAKPAAKALPKAKPAVQAPAASVPAAAPKPAAMPTAAAAAEGDWETF